MQPIIHQQFTVNYTFPIIFTREVFDPQNVALLDIIAQGNRSLNQVLIVIDNEVIRTNPNVIADIDRYSETHKQIMQLVEPPLQICGGESCKNDYANVQKIHALVDHYKLCRHSFIIAIGGGALLDAVGFAAATAHRGIRLIRVPTTVLAQNDAGVGVKNGINAFGRKNFIGTFTPPFAVINDSVFIETLSERDRRAGIAEAVKVALIRDQDFFESLYQMRHSLADFNPLSMHQMIYRCAELHIQHIASSGDPFESGSSRPLDFGHWVAHKLEQFNGSGLRHGEAVAVGIAIDSSYAHRMGLLAESDLEKILTLLETLGFNLHHPALAQIDPLSALEEFREHLGGELTIPLLQEIGRCVEVNHINIPVMNACLARFAR